MPVGPAQTLRATQALAVVGLYRREDVYFALRSSVVTKPEHHQVFDEAFRLFWRDPFGADQAIALMSPASAVPESEQRKRSLSKRVHDAWRSPPENSQTPGSDLSEERIDIDAVLSFSREETFRRKDFDEMSVDELKRAELLIQRMRWPIAKVQTRRTKTSHRRGSLDVRATLRRSSRWSGRGIDLAFRARQTSEAPLVVLCDVSGSMERYARMMMHLLHVLTQQRRRVHSFVFGTRLTHITPVLRHRDIDAALRRLGDDVLDWSGGTRIAAALHSFNRLWARRVLGQRAVAVLITDGLDRGSDHDLAFEAQRLHRSARRVIWLNPLLRFEGFEPLASGVRALLPHVDDFRPVHNLDSLRDLLEALSVDTPSI